MRRQRAEASSEWKGGEGKKGRRRGGRTDSYSAEKKEDAVLQAYQGQGESGGEGKGAEMQR